MLDGLFRERGRAKRRKAALGERGWM